MDQFLAHKKMLFAMLLIAPVFMLFQNCDGSDINFSSLGKPGVCDGISCSLTPLTYHPAVTTILLALGDEMEGELIISGISSQLIAETAIRYSTPVNDPKILFIKDANAGTESFEDTIYVRDKLLSRYNVDFLEEPQSGLTSEHTTGYDLIWLNNPGHPAHSQATMQTLLKFSGGVVVQGDDMTRGIGGFLMDELTGLKYINNGTQVRCDSNTYRIDNNVGDSVYKVFLDSSKFTGANNLALNFNYGNDIDQSIVIKADLEILAQAKGAPEDCHETFPTIVRYFK